MIEHDRLFKELLSTFFIEFLELFLPDLAETIEPNSIRFLQQEYFADLTAGEEKIVDLLVEVKQAGKETAFLVHLETQSYSEANFARRIFFYFARLHQKYLQRIYPIVLFSFDEPQRPEPNIYTIEFPKRKVLEFQFESIQLNQLNWRDFLNQRNPVAAALMAKMRIAEIDRPRVKAECLRLLATLRLDPARTRLISGFVDTYLRLNDSEKQVFQAEIATIISPEQEKVMEIVTSWMEEGSQQKAKSLIFLQLDRRCGQLSQEQRDRISALSSEQLDQLAIALLDFSTLQDLENWLSNH